jgi:hypothetical protein
MDMSVCNDKTDKSRDLGMPEPAPDWIMTQNRRRCADGVGSSVKNVKPQVKLNLKYLAVSE